MYQISDILTKPPTRGEGAPKIGAPGVGGRDAPEKQHRAANDSFRRGSGRPQTASKTVMPDSSDRREPPAEQLFLTLRGAAALLKVHPNTVRAHAVRGLLPAAKVGRDWRFLEADLVAWIRGRYSKSARVQLSADQKEAIWHSGNVQEFITSSSQALTERSLDALLERPTGKRPRNITID
jgi:excisionase family DNA binding protein